MDNIMIQTHAVASDLDWVNIMTTGVSDSL
jgi:hypothetical protein